MVREMKIKEKLKKLFTSPSFWMTLGVTSIIYGMIEGNTLETIVGIFVFWIGLGGLLANE